MMSRGVGILVCLLLPVLVSAQATSEFTIRVFGSTDVTPPTSPTIQTVAPVASSQIDISWATSTDNFAVFGYVLFRDGVPIATTTASSYSDTGLSASTTYSYQVTAFDSVPNYASMSAAVATTTPDVIIPPVATTSTPTSGTRARVVLESLVVDSGVATATLAIETNHVSRIEVRYGVTSSYEVAYIVGNEFKENHLVRLNDLFPGTKYYYEVVGYTPSGGQTVLQQGSFMTGVDTPPAPPTNVSFLSVVQQNDDAVLSYQLPIDFPVDGLVRVVRSHFGYPQFLSDGVVVYEGVQESVLDRGVFSNHETVYYTVFVIDPDGLISSGAIARISDGRVETVVTQPGGTVAVSPTQKPPSSATTSRPDDQDSPAIVQPDVPAPKGFPDLRHFIVEQTGLNFPFSSSTILLSSDEPFVVSVSANHITGDFKTIVATMHDPRDSGKTFSFLLRLNGDRTAYAATIAPLRLAGVSDLVVEVFDYDAKVIGQYQTKLTFKQSTMATTTALSMWYWRIQSWLWWLVFVVPAGVMLLLWFFIAKRDREDEELDEDNASL